MLSANSILIQKFVCADATSSKESNTDAFDSELVKELILKVIYCSNSVQLVMEKKSEHQCHFLSQFS